MCGLYYLQSQGLFLIRSPPQRAFDRVEGSLNLLVFISNENELMNNFFPKWFIDLKRQGDLLTFSQSSVILVLVLIYMSDLKVHHFILFSDMVAIERWQFSNCPQFRLKSKTSKSLKSSFENNSLYRSFEQNIKKCKFSWVVDRPRCLQKLTLKGA